MYAATRGRLFCWHLATAKDDPVTFDLSVGNLKPVIPTPDTYEEVLASAQAAHAAGALFKNVKGRQPLEFAPEPEEAKVDDFDAGESQADDQGLLSADIDPVWRPQWPRAKQTLSRQPTTQEPPTRWKRAARRPQSRHPQNKTNPGQRQMQRRQPARKQTSRSWSG